MNSIQKLLIGASVISMGAITSTPAFALSITGATISGSASYLVYGSNGTNTYQIANNSANVQAVLDGNASSPTGNVELFSNSEQSPISPTTNATTSQRLTAFANFLNYTGVSTLSGQLGSQSISLSSLTAADWFGTSSVNSVKSVLASNANAVTKQNAIAGLYNGTNLASTWFNDAISTNAAKNSLPITPNVALFTQFLLGGGFQRFSDPNISYVDQGNKTGTIRIGLAGHLNAAALFGFDPTKYTFQASELVKVTYAGSSQVKYSLSATNSNLVSNDGTNSHTGNYEIKFQGIKPPTRVPEPSAVLGLVVLGGIATAKKKLLAKA